jgi:hypothetical protein
MPQKFFPGEREDYHFSSKALFPKSSKNFFSVSNPSELVVF